MSSRRKRWTTSCTADGARLSFRPWGRAASLLAAGWLVTQACASTGYEYIDVPPAEMQAFLADKPPELQEPYRRVLREGPRNFVLNHEEAGLAAMELGAWDTAEVSFEQALLAIETVWAENENAEKARSLWYAEGRKDFKGEPYERAMAYYYRGLLFLRRGDYENARASFKGGQLQDALAEDRKYQDDFALLMFLEGWASQQNGDWDMAGEAYAQVKLHRPDFVPPERDHNVLLVAETGLSPMKVATGPGGSELVFQRREGVPEQAVQFEVAGRRVPGYPMEDIFWQAATRGGREIDRILADKVEFREAHGQRGQALQELGTAGMVISSRHRSGEGFLISALVALAGLVEQGVAGQARTEADARYWGNLPDMVHVRTLRAPVEPMSVTADFYDASGRELARLRRTAPLAFARGRSGLVWVRSRPARIH